MHTKGGHYLIDCWEVSDPSLLDDMNYCLEMIEKAVELSNCKVLRIETKKFEPQGLSIMAILSESHCSLHTWPEEAYCAIDLYGCGKQSNLKLGADYFVDCLQPGYKQIINVERGVRHDGG